MDFSNAGKVRITQEKYVADVLTEHPITGTASSPSTPNLFSINESSTPLHKKDKEEFHSVAAKLLYLAKRTRPDLLTLTSFLTSRVLSPTQEDNNKLKHGLRYLHIPPRT